MLLTRMIRQEIKREIAKASQKIGTPIEVDRIRLGVGSAILDDIRIGDDATVIISRMTAELSLNPFSSRFGQLDSLTIHRARVKIAKEIFNAQLRKLAVASTTNTVTNKPRHTIEKLFQALPTEQLWLKSGNLAIVDDDGQALTNIAGLQVLIEKAESKVLFRAASVKTLYGFTEEHLQGRLQLTSDANHYRFFIRKKHGEKDQANDWAVTGRVSRDLSEAEIRSDIHRIPSFLSDTVKPILGENPSLDLAFTLQLQRQPAGPWRFETKVNSKDLRITVPVLASAPIGPLRFELNARGFYRPDDRALAIEDALVSIPPKKSQSEPVRIELHGSGRIEGELKRPQNSGLSNFSLAGISWQGQARLLDASCQSIVDASPANFTPALDDFKLDGRTGGSINLSFDGNKTDSLSFELHDLSWTCRVTEAPYMYSMQHLAGPFTLQRPVGKSNDGTQLEPVEVSVSPESAGFTPLSAIAKNVNNAFIASEDAGFYAHKGIDSFALESAARRNFAEKRVAVGGSTITMQTVKNLFLTHERTVSRKLQELFLAWHLENTLDKDRILEIYLNIVEYGPGIYGITQAANHFFGKNPFDLTLLESAYLASLLPSPKSRYRSFCIGYLTPGMRELVQSLLKRMVGLGRLSWDRYLQATTEGIRFNEVERQSARDCGKAPTDAS